MKSTTVKKSQYRQAGSSLGNQIQISAAHSIETTQPAKDVTSPTNERTSYHQNATTERKCDSCKYRTPLNQCQTFRCKDCGTYIVRIA